MGSTRRVFSAYFNVIFFLTPHQNYRKTIMNKPNLPMLAADLVRRIPECAGDSVVNNEALFLSILQEHIESLYVPQYDEELDAADKLVEAMKKQIEQLQNALAKRSPGITGVMLQCALGAMRGEYSSDVRARFAALMEAEIREKPYLL